MTFIMSIITPRNNEDDEERLKMNKNKNENTKTYIEANRGRGMEYIKRTNEEKRGV